MSEAQNNKVGSSRSSEWSDMPSWFRHNQDTLVHGTFIVAAVFLVILLA